MQHVKSPYFILHYCLYFNNRINSAQKKIEFKVAELMYILEALDVEVLLATLLVWSYKFSDAF